MLLISDVDEKYKQKALEAGPKIDSACPQ